VDSPIKGARFSA